jgi:hypothetical protein
MIFLRINGDQDMLHRKEKAVPYVRCILLESMLNFLSCSHTVASIELFIWLRSLLVAYMSD